MKNFKVANQEELDQFILEHNVSANRSNLEKQIVDIGRIEEWNQVLKLGAMVFLVCELPDNRITMKNFIVKVEEIEE